MKVNEPKKINARTRRLVRKKEKDAKKTKDKQEHLFERKKE